MAAYQITPPGQASHNEKMEVQAMRETLQQAVAQRGRQYAQCTRSHSAFATMIRERIKIRNTFRICYVYLTYLQQRRWSYPAK